VCSFDAINVSNLRYYIDENKCRRCKKCITAKYLEGGCLMDRFLRSKEDK
jgi:phosphoadenosine phosphosulfate reductase